VYERGARDVAGRLTGSVGGVLGARTQRGGSIAGRRGRLGTNARSAGSIVDRGGLLGAGTRSVDVAILFNDRNVGTKPAMFDRDRVLAALAKDGTIYVSLRAMFAQMGAAVRVSGHGGTITAVQHGATVSMTAGKAEIIVNGHSRRSLEAGPFMYRQVLFMPVRAFAEALGAYVQWAPSQRSVVVRYHAPPPAVVGTTPVGAGTSPLAAPAPAPAPALAPAIEAPSTAALTPHTSPQKASYRGFVQGAFTTPNNYNEFAAGQHCPESYVISGGFAPQHSKFAAKVDYRLDAYLTSDNLTGSFADHYTRFATIDGGAALTPVFLARQSSLDVRLEYQVAVPQIYVGVGYLHTSNNYGYPQLNGAGFGIEKLPDLRAGLRFFGSMFFYPGASGNYTVAGPASPNLGVTYRQEYQILKFDVGVALVVPRFPVYVYAGFTGDHYAVTQNAPVGQVHDGPYAGLGVKL
jgi:hypothetical protein